MSGPTVKFLKELLISELHAVEALETHLVSDSTLTIGHSMTLIALQTSIDRVCDQLKAAIKEYDSTEEPE